MVVNPAAVVTKHIFVTGGVVSSLERPHRRELWATFSPLAACTSSCRSSIPYLNVDPGTMNPFQHGEVFVTDDGAETDLDIGHYERFLDINLDQAANVTTGQIYSRGHRQGAPRRVPRRHRAGHPAHHRRDQAPDAAAGPAVRRRARPQPDVIITEIGGTVGDIEIASRSSSPPARCATSSAARTCFFVHVSLVPFMNASGEQKTKPTQHSVAALRSIGIQPDALVLRSDRPVSESNKRKIALMCDVDERRRRERDRRAEHLRHPDACSTTRGSTPTSSSSSAWSKAGDVELGRLARAADRGARAEVRGHDRRRRQVHRPAGCLPLGHRGAEGGRLRPPRPRSSCAGCRPTSARRPRAPPEQLADVDGICVPGGFGVRGIEGKLGALRFARENGIPALGLCLGLQCMVIEYARDVAGLPGASSTEFNPDTEFPVIATMAEQVDIIAAGDMGGTMRLGLYEADARRRVRSSRSSTGRPRLPSATVTATRSTTHYREQLAEAGLGLLGHLARPHARRVRRAAARRAPVLRRHAGASRAAFAAEPRASAVPRADRRRARAQPRLAAVRGGRAWPAPGVDR